MQANITESQMSEKVTFGLVDMAMKCYQGIFKHSDAVEHVFDTEDPDRYPSGSHWTISKLVEVTRKATLANTVVTERVIEMLSAVNFRVRDGQLEAGETTIKGLSGRGQPGNKGLLDLVLMQYQLRTQFLNETLASLPIPAGTKDILRTALMNHAKFEKEHTGNIAWIGVLGKAAQIFQNLVRRLCFTTEFDFHLKRALKSQQSVAEVLQESPFAEILKSIVDATGAAASAASTDKAAASAAQNDGDADDSGDDHSVACHQIALGINLATQEPEVDAQKAFSALRKIQKQQVKEFELEAMRLVDIGCQLLVEKPTTQEMANDIRATERATLRGSDIDGYFLWVYSPRVAGESTTQPRSRPPPLRSLGTQPGGNHIRKMLTAAMSSRHPAGENWEIIDGDLFVISDGGRHAKHNLKHESNI